MPFVISRYFSYSLFIKLIMINVLNTRKIIWIDSIIILIRTRLHACLYCNNSVVVADFPSAVKRLLRNDILMFRTASSVLHILPIAGLYTFLPKYLESQFRLPAHHANMISGNYREWTCKRGPAWISDVYSIIQFSKKFKKKKILFLYIFFLTSFFTQYFRLRNVLFDKFSNLNKQFIEKYSHDFQ